MVDTTKCPCGTDKSYNDCCKPLHQGEKFATSAEELMRSRYTAYVKKLRDYLLSTWHSSQREAMDDLSFENGLRWSGLKVISTKAGQPSDNEGEVEFIASYNYKGKIGQLPEHSHFIKENGRWYYTGVVN